MTWVGKWTLESYRHSHLAFSLFQKLRQLPLYLLCVPGRIGSSSVCNQNTFFVRRGKNRAVGLLEYSLDKLLRLMSFTENTSFTCWLLKSWVLFSFAVLGTLYWRKPLWDCQANWSQKGAACSWVWGEVPSCCIYLFFCLWRKYMYIHARLVACWSAWCAIFLYLRTVSSNNA